MIVPFGFRRHIINFVFLRDLRFRPLRKHGSHPFGHVHIVSGVEGLRRKHLVYRSAGYRFALIEQKRARAVSLGKAQVVYDRNDRAPAVFGFPLRCGRAERGRAEGRLSGAPAGGDPGAVSGVRAQPGRGNLQSLHLFPLLT